MITLFSRKFGKISVGTGMNEGAEPERLWRSELSATAGMSFSRGGKAII